MGDAEVRYSIVGRAQGADRRRTEPLKISSRVIIDNNPIESPHASINKDQFDSQEVSNDMDSSSNS